MKNEFDTCIVAAPQRKKIPLVIVAAREFADFKIKGAVEKQKASWAKPFLSARFLVQYLRQQYR